MTIRSWVSSIMGVIELERLSYLPLNLKNCSISLCLHRSIYTYQPISSKLGQNTCIYDSKISDDFDYGCDQTRKTGVICS